MIENEETVEKEETGEVEFIPTSRYEKVLYSVYKNESLCELLRVLGYALSFGVIYAFLVYSVKLLDVSYILAAELWMITGVPFLAVSLVRRLINAPRPYELLPFYERKPKRKSGSSFPSRHVFSAFVIGVALMPYSLLVGILVALCGVALAITRVLLGVHFIRDVAAGAIIGALCGGIGLIVLHFI